MFQPFVCGIDGSILRGMRNFYDTSMFSLSSLVGRMKRGTGRLLPDADPNGHRRWHIHLAPKGGAEIVLEMETVGWRKIRIRTTMAVDPQDHPDKLKTWHLRDGAFGTPVLHEVLGWALPDFDSTGKDRASASKLAAIIADIAMRDNTPSGGPVIVELDLMAGHVVDVKDTAHRLLHAAVDRAEKSILPVPAPALSIARSLTDFTLGTPRPTLERRDQSGPPIKY